MSYDMTDGGVAAYHRLQLEGREKLSVSGVEDVVRFDENCIVTTTSAGTLIITGEELHIGSCRWTAARCRWMAASTP